MKNKTHSIIGFIRVSRISGFTLLEILVAIAIFGTVVTLIFGSFNMIFGNVEPIKKSSTTFDMAKSCLNRMTIDLNSIYVLHPPAYSPQQDSDEEDPYRVVGETGFPQGTEFARLRFTSLAHVPLGSNRQTGIAEIVYYVQQTSDNTYELKRSDKLEPYEPFEEKGEDPILCRNLLALTVKYIDGEGEEHDTWDSEAADFKHSTPRAVNISLLIGDDETSHKFQTTVLLSQYRESNE